MEMKNIPFGITDWTTVEAVEHKGEVQGIGRLANLTILMCIWLSTLQAILPITGVIKGIFYSVWKAS